MFVCVCPHVPVYTYSSEEAIGSLGLELDSPQLLGMDSGNSSQILIGAFNH